MSTKIIYFTDKVWSFASLQISIVYNKHTQSVTRTMFQWLWIPLEKHLDLHSQLDYSAHQVFLRWV